MKELHIIQQRLKVGKDRLNSFSNFKYRSCSDILEAVKPLLDSTGCTLILSDDIVECAGRAFVKATATLTNADGDTCSVTSIAEDSQSRAGMDSAQVTGSASSYARKYALNGLFAIDDTKDPDTDEYTKQVRDAEYNGLDEEAFKRAIGQCNSEEMLKAFYNANIGVIEANPVVLTWLSEQKAKVNKGRKAK